MSSPSLSTWTIRILAAVWLAIFGAAGFVLLAHAEQPPPTETIAFAPTQIIAATLVKTVGLTAETACTGADRVEIEAGTTVYFCYTLKNSGDTPFAPLFDGLIDGIAVDGSGGEAVTWTPPSPDFLLAPGETLTPTTANGLIRTVAIGDSDVTTRAQWTVDPGTGTAAMFASNFTTVDIVVLKTEIVLTVGTTVACSTATNVTLTSPLAFAYYCVTIINAGPITLTSHLITIPALNLKESPLSAAVAPNARLAVTALMLPTLAQALTTPTLTSRATVTSKNANENLTVTTTSDTVSASVPPAAISLQKSLNTDPATCSNTTILNEVSAGQSIYYCLTVSNSNSLTFTFHTFTEPALGISASFWTELPPGGKLVLTNSTLPSYGVAPVLGPFQLKQSINNQMFYTATNPTYNYRASTFANASINVALVTPKPTDEPTPTFTPTPGPSPIPTWTSTPIPATPTTPPTWTPTPIPTATPTVFIITTPGGTAPTPYPSLIPNAQPAAQPGPFVSPLDPIAAATATAAAFGFPTPVLDPFGATATAVALGFPTPVLDPFGATATAVALGFPTPVLDPFGATATAVALGFPTPVLDPFGATATAVALGFPTPVLDPFGATATAVALGFPTPVLDPVGATATAAVQMGLVAPAPIDPAGATATAVTLAAVAQPLPPTITPAQVAVLPPQYVITVTATSTPALPETATQRPIAPPATPPALDGRSLFTRVLDAAGMTMTLLWFLAGSVLFFVTAGVLAGLSFRTKARNRYTLTDGDDSPYRVEMPVPAPPPDDDDHWPASLP